MSNKSILMKLGLASGVAITIVGMYFASKELTYNPRRRRIKNNPSISVTVSDDIRHDKVTEIIHAEDKQNKFKPHYIIIHTSLEDLSFNGVPRFTRRISVPLGLSNEELKQNLSHAAWRLLKEKNAAAVIIWAHRDDDKKRDRGFTAGKCILAPFGDWSKATTNFSMDSLKTTFEFAEVYSKDAPIYKVMGDTSLRNDTSLYEEAGNLSETTITSLKKGTRVIILDHYRLFFPSDFEDWYKIQTNFSKKKNYSGWVKEDNLIEPTKVISAESLQKVVSTQPTQNNKIQSTTKQPSVNNKKWYEGGTLKHVSLPQWRRATYENKLATCASLILEGIEEDLFKFNVQKLDWDSLKSRSNELVLCIDSYANASDRSYEVEKQTVIEVAALAMLLLGWAK